MKQKMFTAQFIVRSSHELKEDAVKVAKSKGLNLNSYVRLVLSEAIKQEKKGDL